MKCICGEAEIEGVPEDHPEWCSMRVYMSDPHIGATHVMGWYISTVVLPGTKYKPGFGYETFVFYHDTIMSGTKWGDENMARYWHLRTVMDIIRNEGRPAPVDHYSMEEALVILLMAHQASVWCDVHRSWSCGCY